MKTAGARLAEKLETLELRSPSIRYLSAGDAREHQDPVDLRRLLVSQISCPVRWTATVDALAQGSAKYSVECGPGGVLASLVKRISRGTEIQTAALETPESFTAASSLIS